MVQHLVWLITASIPLVILCTFFFAVYSRSHKYDQPKGYVEPRPSKNNKRTTADPTRDAYREKKVPQDLDYIVIGSGMGSLYCAGLLAKAGKKVLVLEQHYVAGGCTHSFHDKGYEFDTGLHYVGRIEKYKNLFDLVTGENATPVTWAKMGTAEDGFCYDEIKLGQDDPFKLCAGEKNFIDNLAKQFPDERLAINEYVRLCKHVNKIADMYFYCKLFPQWLQWLLNKLLNKEYFTWASKTTQEVLDSLSANQKFKALLCGQYGDYGLRPQESSFLIHAGIVAHYMDGAYYPVGGSQRISAAIIPAIEEAGGRVLVRAKVTSIEIDPSTGRAIGVRVAPVNLSGMADETDSKVLLAKDGIISGAGAFATEMLVPEGKLRERLGYRPMLKKVGRSISHVYAFIGMNGTTEELGLRAANLWVLDVDSTYNFVGAAIDDSDKSLTPDDSKDPWAKYGKNEDEDDILLFMGFPSVKDPSFSERFPGKATCEIISTAHTEWFDRFIVKDVGDSVKNPNQSGKRTSEEYAMIKKGLETKLLAALYRHYPKCRGKVDYVSIGTPLTNLYYLGRPDSYGLEHTTARYAGALDQMRPQTNIPGMYVTGQDVCTVGVVGALNGGILTAHAALGYGFWDLVISKRNLIEDLLAMKSSKKKQH